MWSWIHDDRTLKIAAVLIAVAVAVKASVPDNTIAYRVADQVIALGAMLGVTSTTSRAKA